MRSLLCSKSGSRAGYPAPRAVYRRATRRVAAVHGLCHRRHRRAAARGRLRHLLRAQRDQALGQAPGPATRARRARPPASPRPTSRRSATRPSTPAADRARRAAPKAPTAQQRRASATPGPRPTAPESEPLANRPPLTAVCARLRAPGHVRRVELRGCPPLFRYAARRTLLLIDRGAHGAPVALTAGRGYAASHDRPRRPRPRPAAPEPPAPAPPGPGPDPRPPAPGPEPAPLPPDPNPRPI